MQNLRGRDLRELDDLSPVGSQKLYPKLISVML